MAVINREPKASNLTIRLKPSVRQRASIATIAATPIVNLIQRRDRLDCRTHGPAIRWSRLQGRHAEEAKE
jgi:hypothetical protein